MLSNLIRLRWICLLLLISCAAGCPQTPQQKSMNLALKAQDTMRQMDYETSIEELERSLNIWPENYVADLRLGWIYATCPDGRFRDGQKALMHARRALNTLSSEGNTLSREEKDYRKSLNHLALAVVAAAEARMSDLEAAVRTQEEAIDTLARISNLTDRDLWLPRYRSILKVYEAGMPLVTSCISPEFMATPGSVIIAHERGDDAVHNGDYQAAVRAFEDLAPGYPSAEMRLAWIYATCPDSKWRNPREAVVRATQALKKSREHRRQDYMTMFEWELLATLAAAYAEVGDFEKAVQTQEESLRATRNAVSPVRDEARGIAMAILELYKAGKPLRAKVQSPIYLDAESVRELLKNKE